MIDDPDDYLSMTLRGTAREVIKISRDLRDIEESVLNSMDDLGMQAELFSGLQRFDLADQTLQELASLLNDLSNNDTRLSVEGITRAIDTLKLGALAQSLRTEAAMSDDTKRLPPTIDMF